MRLKKTEVHQLERNGRKLLLNVPTSLFYEIDEIAFQILKLCNGNFDRDEIVENLSPEYDKKELEETLDELEKNKILVPNKTKIEEYKPPDKSFINCISLNVCHDCT